MDESSRHYVLGGISSDTLHFGKENVVSRLRHTVDNENRHAKQLL